ncbi:DUF362 domain-containing protein, partial [Candidatus Sumerlaeota bacterium]|nr:DUF362 domain-containing protein [Candidatus Sumerlaeota bacterium]
MTHPEPSSPEAARAHRPSRRKFLVGGGAAALAVGSAALWRWRNSPPPPESVWVGKASDYALDLSSVIQAGLKQLGVHAGEIKKRRILLKPNLVEAHRNAAHINTHPLMVRAAAEAFLKLGAESVTVAEGPGHQSDTIYVLEESGFADALMDDHLPFVDLNYDSLYSV